MLAARLANLRAKPDANHDVHKNKQINLSKKLKQIH
jgi:hypothetical protein